MRNYWSILSVSVALFAAVTFGSASKALAQAVPVSSSGQVKGKVVLDSDGSAVAGVSVILAQLSSKPTSFTLDPVNSGTITVSTISSSGGTVAGIPITGGSVATTVAAASAADGSFTAAGLAGGQFAVCVKDTKGSVIDPCLWTDSRTTVTVTTGKLASGLVVRVKKASNVTVRINDTAQVMARKPTDTNTPHVLVGAFDMKGGFHPAHEVVNGPTGVTYQLPIPVDSPIRLSIISAQIKLATAANSLLPAQGYSTTFVQPSAQSQSTSFTFNAVGRN